ncbi:MAG: hypothetical protein F6K31_42705 [Symploca sp. SIO2G7]|nr:hypothetical protein [Symploca sp. SIO2G7]
MKRNKLIKDHVTSSKTVVNLLNSKFGFSVEDLEAALSGDRKKLQKFGEAARQGRLTKEMMPLLEQASLDIIQGTEVYNTSMANILKNGASSSSKIDKASQNTILANQRYINQKKEQKTEAVYRWDAEKSRHQYTLNFMQLRAYIDQYLNTVDNEAALDQQSNRPELKQVAENRRYSSTTAKHLIENGSEARLDLLPRKEYLANSSPKVNVAKQFLNNLRQALGV